MKRISTMSYHKINDPQVTATYAMIKRRDGVYIITSEYANAASNYKASADHHFSSGIEAHAQMTNWQEMFENWPAWTTN